MKIKENEKIRPFRFKDIFSLKDMVGEEWNLGKRQSGAEGDICAWLYAFSIAADATEIYTFERDGEPAGFIGYNAYCRGKKLRQRICDFLFGLFYLSPAIKDRARLDEYYDHYEYVPEEMKSPGTANLSILIAGKSFRGERIGYRLFEFLLGRAKKDGITRLLIETDESCSVGFYEKRGCTKIKEIGICDEQGTGAAERAFLFEKRI